MLCQVDTICRKGEESDLIALGILWREMINELLPDNNPNLHWWIERTRMFMDIEGYELFVAERNGSIVGFIDAMAIQEPTTGEMQGQGHHFYVRPEYRNKGVAERLYRMMMRVGRYWGVKSIEVMAYSKSEAIWNKLGFKRVGQHMRR